MKDLTRKILLYVCTLVLLVALWNLLAPLNMRWLDESSSIIAGAVAFSYIIFGNPFDYLE